MIGVLFTLLFILSEQRENIFFYYWFGLDGTVLLTAFIGIILFLLNVIDQSLPFEFNGANTVVRSVF